MGQSGSEINAPGAEVTCGPEMARRGNANELNCTHADGDLTMMANNHPASCATMAGVPATEDRRRGGALAPGGFIVQLQHRPAADLALAVHDPPAD